MRSMPRNFELISFFIFIEKLFLSMFQATGRRAQHARRHHTGLVAAHMDPRMVHRMGKLRSLLRHTRKTHAFTLLFQIIILYYYYQR